MSTSAASLNPRRADVMPSPISAAINTARSPKRAIIAPAGNPPSVAPAPTAASTIAVVSSGIPDRVRYSGSTGIRRASPSAPAMTGK